MRRLPRENYSEEQREADEESRRLTLLVLLDYVHAEPDAAIALVELTVALDLDVELAELAGPAVAHPERHRRLLAARQAAGLAPRLVADPDDG